MHHWGTTSVCPAWKKQAQLKRSRKKCSFFPELLGWLHQDRQLGSWREPPQPVFHSYPNLSLLRFITWLSLITEIFNLLERNNEITQWWPNTYQSMQPSTLNTWYDSKTTTRAFESTLSGYLFCGVCIIGCILEALDNARNAEWPSKAQQVGQVAEGAAEQDWPSKSTVHGQPNGGTPVWMVFHLFLETETGTQWNKRNLPGFIWHHYCLDAQKVPERWFRPGEAANLL